MDPESRVPDGVVESNPDPTPVVENNPKEPKSKLDDQEQKLKSKLDDQEKMLKSKLKEVQQRIKDQQQGDEIEKEVKSCISEMEKLISLFQEFLDEQVPEVPQRRHEIEKAVNLCRNEMERGRNSLDKLKGKAKKKGRFGWGPKPMSHDQLTKKAEDCVQVVAELLQDLISAEMTLSETIRQQEDGPAGNDFIKFKSRKKVFNEIMDGVESPSINSIGVYGKAGIGKTMLVEQIRRKAEQLRLFDDVVMAKVTKNPDLKRIQNEMARDLGLELPDRVAPEGAADLIKSRLTNRRVLVILDDICARIDLEKVGIPSGDMQELNQRTEKKKGKISSVEEQTDSTVLLTSRDPDVLSGHMHAQKIIKVSTLEYGEPLYLFKKIAFQQKTENPNLKPLAKEIAKRCGGSPISIQTLANTLKSKSPQKWRTTLLHLRRPGSEVNLKNEMSRSLCSAIKLRYGDLKTKELKQTLLLSSLLGHNAGLQDLLKYGAGLGLFPRANSIERARDEALKLVRELITDHSLLLEGGSTVHFDMHDPIRDVAISIASEDQGVMAPTEDAAKGDLDKEELKKSKWIYLSNVDASRLPDELNCPHLTFFHLSTNKDSQQPIPDGLFKGTEGLRVLGLTKVHSSSMPKSISLLINLHSLCLDESVFEEDIDPIIGELKNLQVLSLARCNIKKLPTVIAKLIRLKFLDLSDCTQLEEISPGVLSRLTQLEELYLGNSYQWGKQGCEGNASLDELKQLGNLTTLEVHIHDIDKISNGLFSTDLKRYKIFIGDVWSYWDSSFKNSKTLKLKKHGSPLDYSVRKLLKKTEELHLEELNDVNDVVNELDDNGFQELKYLHVKNDPKIKSLFTDSVKHNRSKIFPNLQVLFLHNLNELGKIFDGRFEETSFNKLRIITIEQCNQLKNLFSFSVAKQLWDLQEIRVTSCSKIVEIVDDEGQGDGEEQENDITEATGVIKLAAQLQCFRLQHLPEFISFGHEKVTSSSPKSIFKEKLVGRHEIWNLTKLIIEDCDKLENLFSSSIVKNLEKLEYLNIRECYRMREIIVIEKDAQGKVTGNSDGGAEETVIFKKLKFLQMDDLQNLVKFYSGNYYLEFPSLKQLAIENCPKLKGFVVDDSTSTDMIALFDEKVIFPALERLTISQLKKLKIVWHKFHTNSFKRLNFLHIDDLQNLIGLCWENRPTDDQFSDLKQLIIEHCPQLNGFRKLESSSQALFDKNNAFTKLERLCISHFNNLKIWENLAADSFQDLKSLRVAFCQSLSTIFPNDMLRKHFKSLEKLELIDCSSVEVVFEVSENTAESDAEGKKFKELYIDQLPKLQHVWNKDIQGIAAFKSLESVTVSRCDRLNHLFPFSLAKSLSELKRLEIQSCSGLKEIVAMESGGEECDSSLFPSLSCLILYCLPGLTGFHAGKQRTWLQTLEKFYSYRCGEDEKINEQDQLEFPFELPLLSLKKEDIPKLKKLSLTADHIRKIKNKGSLEGRFRNIKVLRIQGYDDGSMLPVDFIQKFNNLNKLSVAFCGFEELFPSNSKEKPSSARRLKQTELPNLRNVDSSVPQKLETLKVWHCQSLVCLSTSTASFQTLTTLDVWDCQKMKNLVSFSTAETVVLQLKSLSIRECPMMTEIVKNQGRERQEINFKELRCLRLECLTSLTSFCSGNFTFKFPSLERVIVNQCPKLRTFCHGDLETPILQRVQSLKRKDKWHLARNLNTAIEKFYEQKVGYLGLESVNLSEFPDLIKEWEKLKDQEFSSFRRLTSLEICNESKLTYLLTLPMAMELVGLRKLMVKDCNTMGQIISGEAEVVEEEKSDELVFLKLEAITLGSCSKLKSFFSGISKLKFPSLKDVNVVDCPNMIIFPSTVSREQEQVVLEPFFSTKVEVSKLEKLTLSSVNVQPMCSDAVQNLTELVVKGCDSLGYLIPFSTVQSFSQLKKLVISRCKKMTVVIETKRIAERGNISESLFPKLESMELEDLQKLTSFCSESKALSATAFKFPRVTELKFSNLPKLKSFLPQWASGWPSLTSINLEQCERVQTFALELPSSKGTGGENQFPLFWVNLNEEQCFEKLRTLEVSICHGLGTLFGYMIAKRLKQLSEMSITNCSNLKEIVACGDDDVKDEIVFEHLKTLRLDHLSSLKGFCHGKCNFDFPSLQEAIVHKCPKMNTFSKEDVKTPELQKVKRREGDAGVWKGNLKDTIRELPNIKESWSEFLSRNRPKIRQQIGRMSGYEFLSRNGPEIRRQSREFLSRNGPKIRKQIVNIIICIILIYVLYFLWKAERWVNSAPFVTRMKIQGAFLLCSLLCSYILKRSGLLLQLQQSDRRKK